MTRRRATQARRARLAVEARLLRASAVTGLAFALAGCDDDRLAARTGFLTLTPEAVDFGRLAITQQRIEALALENIETVDADLSAVTVEDDCGGCFAVLEAPTGVPAKTIAGLPVRFRPNALGVATATLTVDASSPDQTLFALLRGEGSDERRPDVVVTPERVDFGFVPAGGIAVGSFTVRSTGSLDLIVDRIRVEPPEAPFRITTSTPTPAEPGILAPGTGASVGLRAELPMVETGTRSARILIETNVLEEKNFPGAPGVVAVPLSAQGNLPPVAVVGDDLTVEPFTQVELDGSGSFDQDDPPDEPLSFQWLLTGRPGGSTVELVRPTTARPVFRPDLAGVYELALVVRDGLGLESAPARLVVDAVPDEAVRIELIWDHPDSDLDLHLIQENGFFCDCETSVHFRNCARQADWFPATPGANPSLDVDDRSGFGPENINIEGDGPGRFVPPGRYLIAVHYFSTAEQVSTWPTTESNATIRIYVFGLLRAEVARTMTMERDVWFAGWLEWPSAEFIPDGTVSPNVQCGPL